jgi:hypothetical protein
MTLLCSYDKKHNIECCVVLFTGLALSMLAKADFSAVAFAQG